MLDCSYASAQSTVQEDTLTNAEALPMPCAAPVMNTTFPDSLPALDAMMIRLYRCDTRMRYMVNDHNTANGKTHA